MSAKKRNSLDEQSNNSNNIRRSWSHLEVRHFKELFKRNRNSNEVKRRNSYASTTSTKTNQRIASESEYKVLNHVHNINKTLNDEEDGVERSSSVRTPVDLYTLQADMEKETDVVTRSRQMRKFIISEIYSTEKSYLLHMKTLKKVLSRRGLILFLFCFSFFCFFLFLFLILKNLSYLEW